MRYKDQLQLPFDPTFAWRNFIKVLEKIQPGETLTFYDFGKKFKFTKLWGNRVSIVSSHLDEAEDINNERQVSFEKTFMASVLKKTEIHLHVYEKSPTRNSDWRKQIYRCTDPDCRSYFPARDILGKRARCAECKKEIIIERSQIKNARIVGLCCEKSKKGDAFRAAQAAVEDLGLFKGVELDETHLEPKEPEAFSLLDVLKEE